jgi:hypothetical protein
LAGPLPVGNRAAPDVNWPAIDRRDRNLYRHGGSIDRNGTTRSFFFPRIADMSKLAISTFFIGTFLLTFSGSGIAADHERAVRDAVEVARKLFQSKNYFDKISGAGTLVDIGDKESF